MSNPNVDFYFSKSEKWQQEQAQLRRIALDCGMIEALKWGVPCYTFQNSNIILIHAFKDYCAFLFFKGAILKDPKGILIQQTKNVQAARQIRFQSTKDITKIEAILKAYIFEAIEVEKAGLKVELKKDMEPLPVEFQNVMDKKPALKKAFNALTPGRQRAYLLHFSSPKQAKTREARIDKNIDRILNGKGLND